MMAKLMIGWLIAAVATSAGWSVVVGALKHRRR